jgi:hypothetical protein
VDTRLAILIAASALLVVAIAYFIGSLAAAGRARRASGPAIPLPPEAVPGVTDLRAMIGAAPEDMPGWEPLPPITEPPSFDPIVSEARGATDEPEHPVTAGSSAHDVVLDDPLAPTPAPASTPTAPPEWHEVGPAGTAAYGTAAQVDGLACDPPPGGSSTGQTLSSAEAPGPDDPPPWSPQGATPQAGMLELPVVADELSPSHPAAGSRRTGPVAGPDESAPAWTWSMPESALPEPTCVAPATTGGGLLGPAETIDEPPPPSAAIAPPVPARSLPPTATPEYHMVAPVELLFTDGPRRIGIRPGTATFLKYQRLAAVLLADLKRARSSAH